MKRLTILVVLIAVVAFGGYVLRGQLIPLFFAPQLSEDNTPIPEEEIEVIAKDLEIPWEIAFLPDGDLLITERPGRLLRIGEEEQVHEIAGVEHVGEGGLLGIALHPEFEETQWVYLYLTTRVGRGLENRVERYVLDEDSLRDREVILSGIPGASFHDGGKIAFGPDGMLYATTGDAGRGENAQDLDSLAGKILRLAPDGSIPEDNPFQSPVWSYGHRNPQGLVWDGEGRLWGTEHGRSGILSGFDELNLIEKGKNYGWPVIQGDETAEGMQGPVAHSGPNTTWAPAGIAAVEGKLYFAGLRGSALYEADPKTGEVKVHLQNQYGRLRAVQLDSEGMLYVSTSNRDGRGTVRDADDKILKISPDAL